MSRLCPGLPDFAALSRIPARLHKWRCGTSINSVYYRISVRISRCLVGMAIHNCPKVGVVRKISRALRTRSLLCPSLSCYKLGNYAFNYCKRAQAGSSHYRWGRPGSCDHSRTRVSLPTSVTWGSRSSVALHIFQFDLR